MNDDKDGQTVLARDSPATGSRIVPRPTKPSTSTVETVLLPFAKSWAAMLLLIILAGLGYEAHVLLQGAGANVTAYVAASGKNLDALMAASVDGAKAHTALQDALSNILAASTITRQEIVVNTEKLSEILSLLQESIELLKNSPAEEAVQMASLKRIELAIAELTLVVKESQATTIQVLDKLEPRSGSPP